VKCAQENDFVPASGVADFEELITKMTKAIDNARRVTCCAWASQ
jgi:hypothetical protein